MSKIKKIVLSALLLASLIILARFLSIKTPILVISFSFIPLALSAILLGPAWTATIAILGDLIGATLFPSGPFFPGFTLSAGISGLIYGLLLYKKPEKPITDLKFILKITLSTIIVFVIVNIGLNTLWISMLYNKAVLAIIPTRAIAQAVMFPIQVLTIYVLEKALRKPIDKYLRD